MADLPIRVTEHADWQGGRRGLDMHAVVEVVRSPQQVVPVGAGREFRQSLADEGRTVIRVLVDVKENELVVVTMYKTSKVEKYWQP